MIIESVVLVALHVDEIERRCPDLVYANDNEPEAADAVQNEDQLEDELEYLQSGFILLSECQLLHEGAEARDSCNL